MRKFLALLCTVAFVGSIAGAALAGPGCMQDERVEKPKEEVSS